MEKLRPLEREGIREVLESLYRRHLSLKKVATELRKRGINIRPKDLVIIFECLNIHREKTGCKSDLLRVLGGSDRAREILGELYKRLGKVVAVHRALSGFYIPENVKDIFQKYGLKPFPCTYLEVYRLMRRLGILKRKARKKIRELIKLLGGEDRAREILSELYNRVTLRKDGSIRYYSLADITEEINKMLGEPYRVIKSDIRELMMSLKIERRQPSRYLPLKPFGGTRQEMFYIWGLCFGDARLQLHLTSIRVDARGTLPTILCFYEAFKEYIPETSKPPYRKIKGNEYEFSHSFDHKSFSFLLWSPEKAFEEVRSREDLAALLAGLIDSEGSIMYRVRKREYVWKNRKRISYTFDNHIEITNSNYHLLEKIKEMLHRYGIQSSIPRSKTGFGCWRLRINKRSHIAKIAPLLLRYMKHGEKKQRLEILYNIIQKICNMKQKQKREFLKKLEKK